MNRKLIFCLVLVAAMCSMAWAWSGTVINVNSTNTTDVNGNTGWWDTGGWNNAPEWKYRTPYGLAEGEQLPVSATAHINTNGDVYQTLDSGEGGPPNGDFLKLKATITLPGTSADDYYVYVFFWNDEHDSPWRIHAGLSEAECDAQLFIGGSGATGPVTPIPVARDSGERILWAAQLDMDAEGGSTITIYTDGDETSNSNERSWLDAYGYGTEAVPEPMTIALLGLGGLLLRRRR